MKPNLNPSNAQLEAMFDNQDVDQPQTKLTSVEVQLVGRISDAEMQEIVNEVLDIESDPEKLIIFATHPMNAVLVDRHDGGTLLHIMLAPGVPEEDVQSLVDNLANLQDIYKDLLIRVTDLEERQG